MFDMSEYAQHEKLEEMGFPPLHDDKGQVQPRGMHPFPFSSFLFFIQLEVLVTASDTFGFMTRSFISFLSVYSCPQPFPVLRNSKENQRRKKVRLCQMGAIFFRARQSKSQTIRRKFDETKFSKP
jgi:hypothetical protein